ncbi:MAG: hypothetical protein ACOYU7_02320 [Bacillota bacterium]
MGLYEELSRRKENGESLDFNTITYDELFQLWGVEAKPDVMIADLYGVDKKLVTDKRHNWGIKQGEVFGQLFFKLASEEMAATREVLFEGEQTDKVKKVLAEVLLLPTPEYNAFIRLLIETDSNLKEMVESAKAFKAMHNAVDRMRAGFGR